MAKENTLIEDLELEVIPTPFVQIPLDVMEDRLLGAVDVEQHAQSGPGSEWPWLRVPWLRVPWLRVTLAQSALAQSALARSYVPMRPPTAREARSLAHGCPLGPVRSSSPLGCGRE
jgi:hypothetical protein